MKKLHIIYKREKNNIADSELIDRWMSVVNEKFAKNS